MGRRPVWAVAASVGMVLLGACAGDDADGDSQTGAQPPAGDAADRGGYESAPDLADGLGCELDGVAEWEQEDVNYMAPVRSRIMTDAVVCRLPSGESAHIFYRPAEAGPLSDEELSHAFSHPPQASTPGSAPPDCSPWLVIGRHFVIQLGSDRAVDAVRDTLGPDVRSAEPTTLTPISLLLPGPCSQR